MPCVLPVTPDYERYELIYGAGLKHADTCCLIARLYTLTFFLLEKIQLMVDFKEHIVRYIQESTTVY